VLHITLCICSTILRYRLHLDSHDLFYEYLQKARVKEAGMRYSYALKKFPKDSYASEVQSFIDLHYNLLLSLSRCKRKLGVGSA